MSVLSAERYHACGLWKGGEVRFWGANFEGQRRAGDTMSAVSPVPIVAGCTHTCALISDGLARCWGSNYDGALGVPLVDYSAPALPVQAW